MYWYKQNFIFPTKVQGKTKLLAGGRYLKSRWLFCHSHFEIFYFFSIFRLSTIFLIFSDTGMVFSGKFYMENIFLGIFLNKIKAGIAKNQNFGDNSFFLNEIFIVTWNGAQKFYTPSGELKIFFESYFWGKSMWKKFQPIWKGSGVQLCSLDVELLN